MASENAWAAERQRFVTENGTAAGTGTNASAADPTAQDSLLGEQFAQLARELFAAETTQELLQRIVSAATQVVPGVQLASLTLRDEREQLSTPVQTNELAARLDTLQYTHHEGPCVSATLDDGRGRAASPDLTRDTQWPSWSPAAVAEGVHSVLAAGLFPDGAPPRLGSINCYGLSSNQLGQTPADQDALLLLAAHAATALSARHAVDAAQREVGQLHEALRSRDVIGQAKGILMAHRGCTAGQAFDTLRQASQDLNRKLVNVAETLTHYPNHLLKGTEE